MGSAQRRAREKANLRRAILDAARELFVTHGYQAVNMRAIANKIEYSATTIYLYFKDKDEILFHLVEEGFALLYARLEKIEITDPVERLRQAGFVYMDFAREQPHYYAIMFQLGDQMVADKYACMEQQGKRTFGVLLACLAEGVAQGKFVLTHDPHCVASAIWAHLHGAASLVLAGRLSMLPPDSLHEFYATVIDISLRGLTCGAAQP